MTYREFVRDLARVDDTGFAEYLSDLRFPTHLHDAYRFASNRRRSVILLPRGHAKTTGAIHHLARVVGETAGRIKIGIATAAEADAVARSRAVRALVRDERFAEVFPWAAAGVASEKWTEQAWTVRGAEAYVEKDATLRAGSLYGLKPGPRFDLLVCDDLIGRNECTTASQRQAAAERFWSVIEPMLTPAGQIIVLGTRWHEDDLYAELKTKGWPVHQRAALDVGGGALWPTYWPADRLVAKRLELGSAIFDLQYQNDPSGMGGNIFRREWFRTVDRLPAGVRRVGVDLASSSKEWSDYTAAVEVLEDADHNLYVTGVWRARLDEGHRAWLLGLDGAGAPVRPDGPRLLWPTRLLPSESGANTVVDDDRPRPISAVNIEAVAYQSTFVRDILASTRLPARAVAPEHDKVTRARAVAARYEGGKVFHLRGAPGIEQLEAELTGFPNAEHDDLVDALGYAADLSRSEFSFAAGKW